MSWKDRQLIGFSVKSPEELKRVVSLGVINMVEIKVQHFPLYRYKDGHFYPNDKALKKLLFDMCGDLEAVQFHLVMGRSINPRIETGLNIGVVTHHEIYLRIFEMLEEIYRTYKIGGVLTLHPPVVVAEGRAILPEREAILNAKLFFEKLDALRIAGKHKTRIGLENMSDPKSISGNVGYLTAHFRTMLWNTRSIGVTIDTGHRRLSENFKVSEFMKLGFEVVNCHFHGNPGKIDPDSFDDDKHQFPHGKSDEEDKNVEGYWTYIRHFRRHRTPVVLEISHLEKYSDAELIENVERIKKDLE